MPFGQTDNIIEITR